jgi:hypothetical protein
MQSIPNDSSSRRRQWRRRTGALLAVFALALPALVSGCAVAPAGSEQGQLGTMRLGLSAELQGVRYYLEGTFEVTGPANVSLSTTPQDSFLSAELEPGSYSVTIQPGFKVLRELNGTLIEVENELASNASQAFDITPSATTQISYQFTINGGAIEFGPGELRINVGFTESNAGCSPGVVAIPTFRSDRELPAPLSPAQLVYAAGQNQLVLRASGQIAVIDLATDSVTTHSAVTQFTDMSLSPEGDYLYAADYGGENIGYGTPLGPSYVHRLALSTDIWEQKGAYIAGSIQATSNDTFVLKSLDQWVSIAYHRWGTTSSTIQLSSWLWPSVYRGDFRYDARRGRLIHGNSGISSPEIQAFTIQDDTIAMAEGTGTYGSAYGYGGSVALATDSSAFYYGRLRVDASNVTANHLVFPDLIYAASGSIAFGNGKYFDAHTGALLGSFGFDTSIYGLNGNGLELWAFDASHSVLRHFRQAVICPAPN